MSAPAYTGPVPREQRYHAAIAAGPEAVMRLVDEETREMRAQNAGLRHRISQMQAVLSKVVVH